MLWCALLGACYLQLLLVLLPVVLGSTRHEEKAAEKNKKKVFVIDPGLFFTFSFCGDRGVCVGGGAAVGTEGTWAFLERSSTSP